MDNYNDTSAQKTSRFTWRRILGSNAMFTPHEHGKPVVIIRGVSLGGVPLPGAIAQYVGQSHNDFRKVIANSVEAQARALRFQ